jgi:hypothetical protein
MTAATTAQQLPAFVEWIQTYGNVVIFFAQMIWWLLTAIAAVWAAWNFQRYVETRMGTLKAEGGVGSFDDAAEAEGRAADAADQAKRDSGKVDVDKFVE